MSDEVPAAFGAAAALVRRYRRAWLAVPLLLALVATAACGSARARSGASAPARRSRPDLLTRAEIEKTNFDNLYDLIESLRSRWLHSRGPDTILGQQGEVQVLFDDNRLGGLSSLRALSTAGIAYIEFIDPVTAAGRWGLGFGEGAIYISTRNRRAP